jgi:hypothetical protein
MGKWSSGVPEYCMNNERTRKNRKGNKAIHYSTTPALQYSKG